MTSEELTKVMHELSRVSEEFQEAASREKRIGPIIVPSTESRAVMEDYISRWAWLVVQKGSEIESAPEDTPQIATADSSLTFKEAVLELVLYGIAYLFGK